MDSVVKDKDGKVYHRQPKFGNCWVADEDMEKWRKAIADAANKRHASLNAHRVARGLRKRYPSDFRRSSSRYDEYLREDSVYDFGEWLKLRYGKGRY